VDRLYRNEGMRGHVVERTSVVNASSRYTCGIMREKDLQGLLELAARLEASGRQAHVQEVMLASGEPRYGIWLGDYGARPEAEKVSRMLEKESAEVFQVWEWR